MRPDQHVALRQRLDLAARFLANQDGQDLLRHLQDRVELVVVVQRKLDVDSDDDVDAHRASDVDRQVADDTAIDQHPAVDDRRREKSRHRHAGANGRRKITVAEHDRLAFGDVRRDGAKRNRQCIEVLDVRGTDRQLTQQQIESLPFDDALRQHEVGTLQTEFEFDRKLAIVLLAAKAQFLAHRLVRQCRCPVERLDQRFEFGRAHARCVKATDDRAHARSGDRIDRNLQTLEFFQDANVRRPARTAAAEHETDARPFGHGCRVIGRRHRADQQNGGHQNRQRDGNRP